LFSKVRALRQQSHFHTLLFGFGNPVSDSRIPLKVIGRTKPPAIQLTASHELKTLIDMLSDFRSSPTATFEQFLFALDAQIGIMSEQISKDQSILRREPRQLSAEEHSDFQSAFSGESEMSVTDVTHVESLQDSPR
jgi:hypothetical protein